MYQQPFIPNNMLFHNQPPYNNTPFAYSHQQLNFPRILDNTHKTLRTINQILPLVNQVGPLIQNASILFKVSKAIKNVPNLNIPTPTSEPLTLESNISNTPTNPTFFS